MVCCEQTAVCHITHGTGGMRTARRHATRMANNKVLQSLAGGGTRSTRPPPSNAPGHAQRRAGTGIVAAPNNRRLINTASHSTGVIAHQRGIGRQSRGDMACIAVMGNSSFGAQKA